MYEPEREGLEAKWRQVAYAETRAYSHYVSLETGRGACEASINRAWLRWWSLRERCLELERMMDAFER
jgi:hypothetical protein